MRFFRPGHLGLLAALAALAGWLACGGDGAAAPRDTVVAEALADADGVVDDVVDAAAPGDGVAVVVDLVDHDLWQRVPDADDPFGHEGPAEVICPDGAWYVDQGLIEVDTERCNHVTVEQPLLEGVKAGDRVGIIAWSGRLLSPDGASEGHVAVAIGDALAWEEWVPIPSVGNFFTPTVVASADAPAGTPVRFHVHNHGFNTWNLVSVRRID